MTTTVTQGTVIWDPVDADAFQILTGQAAPADLQSALDTLHQQRTKLLGAGGGTKAGVDNPGAFLAGVDVEAVDSLIADLTFLAPA